jgi:hypothetical protein
MTLSRFPNSISSSEGGISTAKEDTNRLEGTSI